MTKVKNWLDENGLELVAHRTEAMPISRKRKRETAEFRVGNFKNKSQLSIKYLGVQIGDTLSFKFYMANVGKNASRT